MKTRTWLPVVVMATASVVSMGCAKQINVQVFKKPTNGANWKIAKATCTEWPLGEPPENCNSSSSDRTAREMTEYGTDRLMTSVDVSKKYQLIRFERKNQDASEPLCGSVLLLACPAALEKYPSFDALRITVPDEAFKPQVDPQVWAYCGVDAKEPKPQRPQMWQIDFNKPEEVCKQVCRGGPEPTHLVIAPSLQPSPVTDPGVLACEQP
ncbi:MAG TPA: hypothetical protein PKA58_33900 [Polyangium sp.]|nr:hypothetical protein [Polyangium sp.]